MGDNTSIGLGEAGIICGNCGHGETVTTEAEATALEQRLKWSGSGHPVCPECGADASFEHYIEPPND